MENDIKNIILIFQNQNSLSYWFRNIAEFLTEKGINIKVYRKIRTLNFDNTYIKFITKDRSIMQAIRGKRNVRIIGGLETDLELDFNKTIMEILK